MESNPSADGAASMGLDLNSSAAAAENRDEEKTLEDKTEEGDAVDAGAEVGESGNGRSQPVGDDKSEVFIEKETKVEVATVERVYDEVEVTEGQPLDSGVHVQFGAPSSDREGGEEDEKVRVEEQEQLGQPKRRGRKRKKSSLEASSLLDDQCPRYELPFEEENWKGGFSVSDLVWGKIRSHPWWPGQIFDPSDASEMALKHLRKDNLLVAYFGDKTFAWCEESQLKPFWPYFSQMEKQSNMDSFLYAVDCALEEVYRRVVSGMVCDCIPEEAYSCLKYQEIDNAGIREETIGPTSDRSLNAAAFQPDGLMEYIKALAECPCCGADSLDLAIAKAQLKSFYQSKGYLELPQFLLDGGLDDAEGSPPKTESSRQGMAEEATMTLSDMISGTRKSRPKKRSSFDKSKHAMEGGRKKKSLSELMEEKLEDDHESRSGGKGSRKPISCSSWKKQKVVNAESALHGRSKKKRLDALGDLDIKTPSPTLNKALKVGERLRQVACRMTGTPTVRRYGKMSQKGASKTDYPKDDTVDVDASSTLLQTDKRNIPKYSSPSEMLSQLCLAAKDPMKGHSFLSMIVSFFSVYRETISSGSFEDNKNDENARGRRRRKKTYDSMLAPSDASDSDYMQDSYWSVSLFEDHPEDAPLSNGKKRQGDSETHGRKGKRNMAKPTKESSLSSPSDPDLDAVQHLQDDSTSAHMKQELAGESLTGSPGGMTMDESSPTALILSFKESNALPSVTDLVKFFGFYGPLDEAETEVMRKANRAKVVFKNRADAETAFSSTGKFSVFGPALISYWLQYSLSKPKAATLGSMPENKEGTLKVEGTNLAAPGQEISIASDEQGPAQ